mmetsp:Transcript_26290/g.85001  ORF Transcript_26290/g.85001 Transcript_26290/m.85001 type:complete len:411 (-) Transcript_26290:54-1286(-)
MRRATTLRMDGRLRAHRRRMRLLDRSPRPRRFARGASRDRVPSRGRFALHRRSGRRGGVRALRRAARALRVRGRRGLGPRVPRDDEQRSLPLPPLAPDFEPAPLLYGGRRPEFPVDRRASAVARPRDVARVPREPVDAALPKPPAPAAPRHHRVLLRRRKSVAGEERDGRRRLARLEPHAQGSRGARDAPASDGRRRRAPRPRRHRAGALVRAGRPAGGAPRRLRRRLSVVEAARPVVPVLARQVEPLLRARRALFARLLLDLVREPLLLQGPVQPLAHAPLGGGGRGLRALRRRHLRILRVLGGRLRREALRRRRLSRGPQPHLRTHPPILPDVSRRSRRARLRADGAPRRVPPPHRRRRAALPARGRRRPRRRRPEDPRRRQADAPEQPRLPRAPRRPRPRRLARGLE